MTTCDVNVINIKQGSAVVLNCVYQDSEGNPLSLTNIDIYTDFINPKTGITIFAASTIITPGGGIGGGIIITNSALGEYTIDAGNSAEWPLGQMPLDILYEKAGALQHTDDFILDFKKGRTQIKSEPSSGTNSFGN